MDTASNSRDVLIVEDDPLVRAAMVRILNRNEFKVWETDNGMDALDIAEKNADRIQLVITDVSLPHMDGIQVACRLRNHCPHTPILVVSGYPDGRLDNAPDIGQPMAFLAKPFKPKELMGMIAELMAQATATTI